MKGIVDLGLHCLYGFELSSGYYAVWRRAMKGGCRFGTLFKARAAIRLKKEFSKIIRFLGFSELLINLRLPSYWTSTRYNLPFRKSVTCQLRRSKYQTLNSRKIRKIRPLEPKNIIAVLLSFLKELFASENHRFTKICALPCIAFNVEQVRSCYTGVFNSNDLKIYRAGVNLNSSFLQSESHLLNRPHSTCKRDPPTYYPRPPMEFPFGGIVA